MPDTKTIKVEARGAVSIVTLDRPEIFNAVNPEMASELGEYFAGLVDHLETRVVILRGAGTAFCSGGDLGSEAFASAGPGRAQRQMKVQHAYSGIIKAMRRCPQPIIGLVQGPACGAGFSLALACDVRLATPAARFNAAYFRVGLGGCDMGSGYLLPRLIGVSIASELLMTGRFIGAARALSTGLVSDVVEEAKLLDTALGLAADMLRGSPMGLRMTKDTLNALIDAPSLDTGLALEDRQQVLLMETADFSEAVAAFKEKRAPKYRDQ